MLTGVHRIQSIPQNLQEVQLAHQEFRIFLQIFPVMKLVKQPLNPLNRCLRRNWHNPSCLSYTGEAKASHELIGSILQRVCQHWHTYVKPVFDS